MKLWRMVAASLIVGTRCASYGYLAHAEDPVAIAPKGGDEAVAAPKVDIVFVIDTTGSMGGLIDGAKRKIWSIANEVARAKPAPQIRIGLVAFRDQKEAYVTEMTDLTDDLDGVYRKLTAFKAAGGGDTPEHVNAGLRDAIEKMKWTPEKDALRIIFLVGDAPPHEDYKDAPQHMDLAKSAIEKDIIVNTIRCGNDSRTGVVFAEIAKRAEGTFVTIEQNGGVTAVATPFDAELAELGRKLDGTRVAMGDARHREGLRKDAAESEKALASAPEDSKADRAAAKAKGYAAGGAAGKGDDLVAAAEGEESHDALKKLKVEEMSDEMQKMTPEERVVFLDRKKAEREEVLKQIAALDEKRAAFLKAEAAKNGDKDGFDQAVQKAIHEQAEKKGMKFEK